ncbi:MULTISPECIES: flavin-dependent oxidoreductase [Rhizobium/Agrobacterium group]|uniref:Flavin-dependent oxidoreductase n=1 Tax=Agrobacterium cucumeris TaxID=2862866 RepID=A0ABY8RW37_9HYPH|nr:MULTISPECIES: flavin-dependent oxidoreductase [Rhizobium/Agrobacterium group]MCZ7472721.1 flavin-dependent oxidoreductase [Rhizobium rhizogenes]MCZ7484025.1 flavin-dependent oxidoreductase [Rhizobium rhizogenes]WHO11858.1 flavin-dependent oxidoreductase [Agrobacterium cucumeris]
MKVIIIGAGIGGMTLACKLAAGGIVPEVYDAAPQLQPVGLGINLLPHASKVMAEIGVLGEIARRSVETYESTFFNRFGQHIFSEPAGLRAGYELPQYSVHRGDLHQSLLQRFAELATKRHLHAGHQCVGYDQDDGGVTVHFRDTLGQKLLESVRGDVMVAADGLHSVVRKSLHPNEGDPVYSGVNMWRGATLHKPFLDGANMTRIGWLSTGKLVIYPIRNDADGQGNQLINWVAEIETPTYKKKRDWNKQGCFDDFMWAFEDMKFDWLDVPALLRSTDAVMEFPMVDQDPLPFWSQGRVTLLGDAAHPMYPRGSNGAGQAILDGKVLGDALLSAENPRDALKAYEGERLPITAKVVLTNRSTPPDIILKEVFERTGDKPFDRIEDVISADELASLSSNYKKIAGYDRERVAQS